MIWSKMCRRCGGDLCDREESDAWEVACLQCGRMAVLKLKPARGVVPLPLAVNATVGTQRRAA